MSRPAVRGVRQLNKKLWVVFILLLAVYFCCCLFLHYKHIVTDNRELSVELETYRSDFWGYTRNTTTYSFTGVILGGIFSVSGGNGLLTAVPAALASVLSVVAAWRLLEYLLPNTRPGMNILYAWLVSFEAAIWLPNVTYRHLQTLSATLWHSPTFVLMKPFAIFAVLCYLKVQKNYLEKIDWRNWALFALSLALATAMKPSFTFCFAPAMAVLLVVDLVRTRGKGFRQIILFGCAVLPSVAVCLWEYAKLFGSGSSGENAIRFGLFKAQLATPLYKHPMFPYSYLLSLVVPLLVFWLLWSFRGKGHVWKVIPLTFGIALFQDLFIYEDGPRLHHANFTWGVRMATLLVFVLAIMLFARWQEKRPWPVMKPLEKRLNIMLWAVLGLHAACGLLYFVQLLRGVHYY